MKTKVTRKAMKESYKNIICVGYCNLQNLLYFESPMFYSTRIEGWACDYYFINDNTIISTGYAPIGNITPNYAVQKKYEEQAKKIMLSWSLECSEKRKQLQELLNQFISEVLNNEK